jgi:integrase
MERLCRVVGLKPLQAIKSNVGSPTARSCRSVLSGIMGFAVRRGAVSMNPVREADRLPQTPDRQPRALTAAERAQWLLRLERDRRAVEKDLPDLTRFMLATGVRIGEALAVSWDEINLDTGNDLIPGTVDIAWKLSRVRGKGLKRIARPKSEAGERLLPLPTFAAAMLRRRKIMASLDREILPGGAVPVFPHSTGGWRDPSNTRRDVRDARGSTDFVWVTSHVFRKTCATILDDAGLTARVIADQLGHARPSMTQDVYMGRKVVNPSNARALQAALDTESP